MIRRRFRQLLVPMREQKASLKNQKKNKAKIFIPKKDFHKLSI
jgi:hypothetical protein